MPVVAVVVREPGRGSRGRDQIVQGNRPATEVLPAINEEMNTVLARARARAGAQ